jgi:hypothetical protein
MDISLSYLRRVKEVSRLPSIREFSAKKGGLDRLQRGTVICNSGVRAATVTIY